MTVSLQTPSIEHEANGVTTAFAYPYKVLAQTDLAVYVDGTPQTLTTHYSVSGVGADAGGMVTFVTAPAADAIVSIAREMRAERTTDYQTSGDFLAATVNPDFDRAIMLVQDLKAQLARAVRTPVDELSASMVLPAAASRLGKFLRFHSTTGDAEVAEMLDGVVAISQSIIGQYFQPQTARELAAGITPVNTVYPEGDIRRYGATTASSNNSPAIQDAVNANKGGTVHIPSDGTYVCTANIIVPVGSTDYVVISGEGWRSRVQFSGAAVTKGFDVNNAASGLAAYDFAGGIKNMRISGTSGAKRGVDFNNVQLAFAKRVHFDGFDGTAIRFFDVLMGRLERCLIQGCGNASEYGVHVTGNDGGGGGSTTFVWDQSYISGGLAGGGTTKLGGLGIDRCIAWTVKDGAIESTGTPIVVCGISTANRPSSNGHILGIDLENPGNNLPYIDVGQGWTGTASLAASNLLCETTTCTPSGTTASTYGFRLKNTTGARFINSAPGMAGTPTSVFELDGSGNFGVCIGANRSQYGNAWPWVRENGVHRTDATPRTDWQQQNVAPGEETSVTISGTTPSCLIFAAQGGHYAYLNMGNGGATTVATMSGGRAGMRVTLVDPNGNTTLTHAPGTTNAFRCTAGANLAMAANQHYQFRFDGTRWCQL